MCSMLWRVIPKAMQTPSGNILFKNTQGEFDCLPLSELEAVERSGRSTWQEYAMETGQDVKQAAPVVPLMDARPGKTEPYYLKSAWNNDRSGVAWSYDELCELMRDHPIGIAEALDWGKMHGRSPQAVQTQMQRLRDMLIYKEIRWDGVRLLRGSKANANQWPFSLQNPKH